MRALEREAHERLCRSDLLSVSYSTSSTVWNLFISLVKPQPQGNKKNSICQFVLVLLHNILKFEFRFLLFMVISDFTTPLVNFDLVLLVVASCFLSISTTGRRFGFSSDSSFSGASFTNLLFCRLSKKSSSTVVVRGGVECSVFVLQRVDVP